MWRSTREGVLEINLGREIESEGGGLREKRFNDISEINLFPKKIVN